MTTLSAFALMVQETRKQRDSVVAKPTRARERANLHSIVSISGDVGLNLPFDISMAGCRSDIKKVFLPWPFICLLTMRVISIYSTSSQPWTG